MRKKINNLDGRLNDNIPSPWHICDEECAAFEDVR